MFQTLLEQTFESLKKPQPAEALAEGKGNIKLVVEGGIYRLWPYDQLQK